MRVGHRREPLSSREQCNDECETAQDTDYHSSSSDNIRIIQKNFQNCIFLTLYVKSTVFTVFSRIYVKMLLYMYTRF